MGPLRSPRSCLLSGPSLPRRTGGFAVAVGLATLPGRLRSLSLPEASGEGEGSWETDPLFPSEALFFSFVSPAQGNCDASRFFFLSHPSAEAGGPTWFGGTLLRNNPEIEDPLICCHQLVGAGTRKPKGPADNYYQTFSIQTHKSKN